MRKYEKVTEFFIQKFWKIIQNILKNFHQDDAREDN